MSSDQDHEKALFKYKVIAPALMEPNRVIRAYFQKLETKPLPMPGKDPQVFKASTLKGWYYRYKKDGFKGLLPQKRKDKGERRFVLSDDGFNEIFKFREEWPDLSVAQFFRKCLKQDLLGIPPMCEATLRRLLKSKGLSTRTLAPKARKRFEMERFGQLWVGDFMHGPQVLEHLEGKRKKKAILLAIIDDHSRIIVGGQFSFVEDTSAIEQVFKEALLTYGIPERLYLDNGPSFSSKYLVHVCAELKVGLVHSKPYDSPSRGKIERFFRTVRGKFLSAIDVSDLDLKALNDLFNLWLREDYHNAYHKGIGEYPYHRYVNSIAKHPLQRVDEFHLQECFLVKDTRKVNKDATVSFKKTIYELPHRFIGKKVELRYPQDRPGEVYLYENGSRLQKLSPVDVHYNGKYRPSPRTSDVTLQKED